MNSLRDKRSRLAVGLAMALPAALLVGCGGGDGNDDDGQASVYTLQLLHAADQEGGAPAVEDAPRFSAVLNALRATQPERTLVLSSGDNVIPGPFFSASEDASLAGLLGVPAPGRTDILMLNAMGIQASAFGNHEFDLGPATVASLLAAESNAGGSYPGTAFPYLSSNLDFTADSSLGPLVVADGQPAGGLANGIARSTIITVNGQTIGIVGATTPTLDVISSPGPDIVITPADSNDIAALAAEIQVSVDALTATGIDKVIVLAHMQQIAIEQQLAQLLNDVDIIVAGGSNTILADGTDRLRAGDTAVGTYPLQYVSPKGEPVLVVNTDGNYRYVGRLVVDFDEAGVVLPGSLDQAVNGAYATDEQGVTALGSPAPDATVAALAAGVGAVIAERDGNVFGQTTVYLNGLRESVRTEETNLGNLSADANLWVAQQVDASTAVSIKNGGGIRDDIGEVVFPAGSTNPDDVQRLPPPANVLAGKPEGGISQFDIQNALRFNNELSLVTVTAEELAALVEHAVAGVAPGATPGSFGQVGGIRFSFDPSQPAGDRVQNLLVVDANGAADGVLPDTVIAGGELQGDGGRTFRVVTLNFMADGGDGYPFPVTGRVDLVEEGLPAGVATFADAGSEQDALAEYLAAMFPIGGPFTTADTPVAQDTRIQNLSARPDTVLNP